MRRRAEDDEDLSRCCGNMSDTVELPDIRFCPVRVCLRVAVLLFVMGVGAGYECGGFIDLSDATTGTISSPNYPGSYPTYVRCIWIFEAPANSVAKLTITFTGETYNSACSDFIQIYDGGPTSTQLLKECGTLTAHDVSTSGRWMYVYFESDGITGSGTGLSATYSYVSGTTNDSISNPLSSCRSYEFTCANKLCLSLSYRCDGYYDCGCGSDCDEDGCGGLPINKLARILIGVGVGIGAFVVVAFLGMILEKRHNWEKQQKTGVREKKLSQARTHRTGWGSGKNRNTSNTLEVMPEPTPSPRSACKIRVSELV